MTLEIDPTVNAAYVEFSDGPIDHTERLDENRFIDYGPGGEVVGIEFLAIHRGVDLSDLPYRDQLVTLFKDRDIRIYA